MEWIKSSSTEDRRFKKGGRKLIIFADGGARGNPGPAGVGIVIRNDDGFVLEKFSEFIGRTTNNQAEYQAVIMALEEALNLGAKEVHLYLDSELIVKQLQGEYRVKNEKIKPLFKLVLDLVKKFSLVKFNFIPRIENEEADSLVNKAINLGV